MLHICHRSLRFRRAMAKSLAPSSGKLPSTTGGGKIELCRVYHFITTYHGRSQHWWDYMCLCVVRQWFPFTTCTECNFVLQVELKSELIRTYSDCFSHRLLCFPKLACYILLFDFLSLVSHAFHKSCLVSHATSSTLWWGIPWHPQANAVTYTVTLSACEDGGHWLQALALLQEMRLKKQTSLMAHNAAISTCEKALKIGKMLKACWSVCSSLGSHIL